MNRLAAFILVFIAFILFGSSHLGAAKAHAKIYTAAELLQGTHTVQFISKQFPGDCLDVQAGSTANQTPVQMYDCLKHPNQYFDVVPINATQVNIKFKGKCVDIMWGGTANGTKVWLWDCTGGYAQVWQPIDNDTFRNPTSGRCLDGESAANGMQLKIWDCNGLNYQNWTIDSPNDVPQPAIVEMSSKAFPDKCMDTQYGRLNHGTAVQVYDCLANYPQRKFTIVPVTSTLSTIQYQGKCLDARANGTANGTLIQIWHCTGTANQLWTRSSDGVFRNPQANRCIDVGYNGVNGTWLWLWDCSGNNNQKWHIYTPTELLNQISNIQLTSKQYSGKCIETRNGSTTAGTVVQLNECANNAAQLFETVPINGNSVYIKYKGMCLDAAGGATANGTPIILYGCRAITDPLIGAQQWIPYGNNIFRNARSWTCLHAPSGTNGSQLQLFTCNGSNNQNWGYESVLLNASAGNVLNLNFGISNFNPWIQATCGDVRIDNGVNNAMPAGQFMITSNASCTSPGIVFSGNGTANFGSGQASSTNQVVGGTTYPEVYVSANTGGMATSYEYVSQKAESANLTQTNLTTICTLSNCTLPNNLPNGIYTSPTNLVLNDYTFQNNRDYVFLVNGSLTINGNLIVPAAAGTSVVYAVSGNIIVPSTVGSAQASNAPNISGILSTDRSLLLNSAGNCNDLRFNVEGTIIVNAGRTGGALQNNRNFCDNNQNSPAMQITQRLDFVLNLPEFMRIQNVLSQEVAP